MYVYHLYQLASSLTNVTLQKLGRQPFLICHVMLALFRHQKLESHGISKLRLTRSTTSHLQQPSLTAFSIIRAGPNHSGEPCSSPGRGAPLKIQAVRPLPPRTCTATQVPKSSRQNPKLCIGKQVTCARCTESIGRRDKTTGWVLDAYRLNGTGHLQSAGKHF